MDEGTKKMLMRMASSTEDIALFKRETAAISQEMKELSKSGGSGSQGTNRMRELCQKWISSYKDYLNAIDLFSDDSFRLSMADLMKKSKEEKLSTKEFLDKAEKLIENQQELIDEIARQKELTSERLDSDNIFKDFLEIIEEYQNSSNKIFPLVKNLNIIS